jgi:hypothetical protein
MEKRDRLSATLRMFAWSILPMTLPLLVLGFSAVFVAKSYMNREIADLAVKQLEYLRDSLELSLYELDALNLTLSSNKTVVASVDNLFGSRSMDLADIATARWLSDSFNAQINARTYIDSVYFYLDKYPDRFCPPWTASCGPTPSPTPPGSAPTGGSPGQADLQRSAADPQGPAGSGEQDLPDPIPPHLPGSRQPAGRGDRDEHAGILLRPAAGPGGALFRQRIFLLDDAGNLIKGIGYFDPRPWRRTLWIRRPWPPRGLTTSTPPGQTATAGASCPPFPGIPSTGCPPPSSTSSTRSWRDPC